jgi:hypothetical protein
MQPGDENNRAYLLELLDYHLGARGWGNYGYGPDPYCVDEPHDHPMASALYLRGLVNLHRVTADARYANGVRELAQTFAGQAATQAAPAWGLPFAWRGRPPGSPYVVTTCICGLALIDSLSVHESKEVRRAIVRAASWIADEVPWHEHGNGAGPMYAPGLPDVATNVVSLTGAFLYRASCLRRNAKLRGRALAALRFTMDSQHERGFWQFREPGVPGFSQSVSDATVDILHSAYVLDGLTLALEAGADREKDLFGLRSAIALGMRFYRSELFRPSGEALERLVVASWDRREERRILRQRDSWHGYLGSRRWLVPSESESRLWGYGAALAAAARAEWTGVAPFADAAAIARTINSTFTSPTGRFSYGRADPRTFPRHEAHVFDGLAAMARLTARPRDMAEPA